MGGIGRRTRWPRPGRRCTWPIRWGCGGSATAGSKTMRKTPLTWPTCCGWGGCPRRRSEEHTSELQSRPHLVCRLLLEKKKNKRIPLSLSCLFSFFFFFFNDTATTEIYTLSLHDALPIYAADLADLLRLGRLPEA